ncbi:TadE/TadG family type IV pilus assembly protein [Myxococcus eversor]|uniref:TadE family protein n=1 Tax=Myxococcus sp. AM011 TaxID=2745200 RepID=UPI003083F2BE
MRTRGRQRGTATVEFAIIAPLLIMMVLWAQYFWELQHVRLKAAELARFVAFERTVRPNLQGIISDARERYKDLDGATKSGELPTGAGFRNRLTLTVYAEEAEAPLTEVSMGDRGGLGGAMGLVGGALSALGSTPADLAQDMGLDTRRGAVSATITVDIQNGIIPHQIAFFTTSPDSSQLNLQFTEHFSVFHDTWRAWGYGDHPRDTYARVEQITHDRATGIIYKGATGGDAGGALNSIGEVLQVLGLDFPFTSKYVRESVLIRKVGTSGSTFNKGPVIPTRTVPGDALQAYYWKNDSDYCFGDCEPGPVLNKRGTRSNGGYGDNWPMRSYNCRGNFFQGAVISNRPESEYADQHNADMDRYSYHSYGDKACR